jgi:hypothetical protein
MNSKRNRNLKVVLGSSAGFYFITAPKVLFACPLCKEAVEKIGNVWTSMGFNYSIFFMLMMPLMIVGTFSGALYWNYKKQQKK